MTRILWIGQELEASVARKLNEAGYRVDFYSDPNEGYRRILAGGYTLVGLHLPVPARGQRAGTLAEVICRRVRDIHPRPLLLLVSSSAAVKDKMRATHAGADDFLSLPFDGAKLETRITALICREQSQRKRDLSVGALTLYRDERTVCSKDARVRLTPREFEALWVLVEHHDETISKEVILSAWGAWDCTENTVEVHIAAIRRKLKTAFAEQAPPIQTIYGHGYRIHTQEMFPRKANVLSSS